MKDCILRYSEDILDEIRNRLDIVDVISNYVPLKPSGKGHKGLCPFHQEKTPSFMVDSQKQIFHCFGCGEGGNIFSFIMKIEKVNFPEAVKILAEKAGVQLPSVQESNTREYREKNNIFKLNEAAANYYQDNLVNKQGRVALQYLLKRQFKKEIIEKFQLGFALPGYDNLYNNFIKKKVNISILLKSGLVTKSQKTGKVIDYFRNRIIFPIKNLQGRVVAFGGRVLDDQMPKYINSPETPVYSKGKHLYGLYQARKSIRQKNQIIIMEGYTDVLIAHQYGFENAVASLGTALTNQQIDLIKRYADELIIAFDSDAAGKNATMRSLSILKEAGIKIKVLSIPVESDPADIIIKKGSRYFSFLLENALPLIDYKIKVLMKRYNYKNSDGKLSIVREIFDDLKDIKSQLELQLEVKKIAEKLGLEEETILRDLNRFRRGKSDLPNIQEKTSTESTHINAEKILIGCMLQKKESVEKIFSELKVEYFTVKEHKEIISIIKDLYEKQEKIDIQKIIDKLETKETINLLSKIMLKDIINSDQETVDRSINAIKKYVLQLELDRLNKKIKDETAKNELTPKLLHDYQEILQKIKTIV